LLNVWESIWISRSRCWLLIVIMSAYSWTHRVTHLTCISTRVEWIIGKWVFVWSPGWDPGHHERFRNGLENKIHIIESCFRVPEKFCYFTNIVSDILEGSGVGPGLGPHVGEQRGLEGRWSNLMGQVNQPPKSLAGQPLGKP
jgi:hypothetical protein